MDGRDAMAMSGPASYFMHRGIGAGTQQQHHHQQHQHHQQQQHQQHQQPPPPGFHGAAPPLSSGMRLMPTAPGGGASMQVPSSGIGSMSFQVDSPPAVSSHGGGVCAPPGGAQGAEPVKKKRGRPRKYGPDGSASGSGAPSSVGLALSPISSSGPALGSGMFSGPGSGSGTPTGKRGRGRPPGSGRKQQLASLGEWVVGSAGMGFTPHIITISVGEDISSKIMSFSQQGPRAVCILSANGTVSTVTLQQSANSGGTVTYEGRFEILSLSGSYMLTGNDGSRSRTGGLTISLSSPDGRVIGGGVGGLLIAATPVQVIVGSFIYAGSKGKNKNKASSESGGDSEQLQLDDRQMPPAVMPPAQTLIPGPSLGGWPSSSRQSDMRNAHMDIDLTRG